ncbi:fructosamine kinase family protein [Porticoccus sp. W117]|uniref:fructosamine kinase family protein n=1 Tax=Porticoccus sp. W117 TaxID=3054777 RepID=UPI0025964C41|nr:fructosamine kinase family protein [Porticoccus sp. W117]MDM3870964.1 fructosamine kinase family protein [Porticoccus sp. W117]
MLAHSHFHSTVSAHGTITATMFIKHNHSPYRDALIKEVAGLQLLRQGIAHDPKNPLRIPEVFNVSEQQLTLTQITSQRPGKHQWQQLGEGLARLHSQQQSHYGLKTDNYIGLNPQPNGIYQDWGAFFIQQRLQYQLSLIRDRSIQKKWQQTLVQSSDKLRQFLNDNCPHPSLLHGDLWNGNVLFSSDAVWLIDPAIYCGDREADLAMTEMFGGFDPEFYRAYDNAYPRTDTYQTKREIYNLYHYLNHYNLFGSGYLDGCEKGWEIITSL